MHGNTLARIKVDLEQDLRLKRFQAQPETEDEAQPSTIASREVLSEMTDSFFSEFDKRV